MNLGVDMMQAAANILWEGGVVAYPTEACFGLGCDPKNHVAVERILAMKKRLSAKGLILVADRLEPILPYLAPCDTRLLEKMQEAGPIPVSWVCPAASDTPHWLKGTHHSIAVRIIRHPPAAELCRIAAMALVSTSANVAGQSPLKSAHAVATEFGPQVDLIIDAPIGEASRPSTVMDLLSGEVFRA